MSAIASATASPQAYSPLSRLKTELASEVSAGTISSSDQSALSSALDNIDSAMQASRPAKGSKPPSPDEMQAKIDSLINDQVSSGALTSDQAEDLKSVFSSTFAAGPGGAGGPPPGPPPGESDDSATSASTSSSDSDLTKLLTDFLQSLKESKSSSTGYGSGGDSLTSQLQSLILDYSA